MKNSAGQPMFRAVSCLPTMSAKAVMRPQSLRAADMDTSTANLGEAGLVGGGRGGVMLCFGEEGLSASVVGRRSGGGRAGAGAVRGWRGAKRTDWHCADDICSFLAPAQGVSQKASQLKRNNQNTRRPKSPRRRVTPPAHTHQVRQSQAGGYSRQSRQLITPGGFKGGGSMEGIGDKRRLKAWASLMLRFSGQRAARRQAGSPVGAHRSAAGWTGPAWPPAPRGCPRRRPVGGGREWGGQAIGQPADASACC